MPAISTTLDITIRLALSGHTTLTTVALTDPPSPELTSLSLDGLSLVRHDPRVDVHLLRETLINLTPMNPAEDRWLRFKENLLTALNGEAEEALLEAEGDE